MNRTRCVFRNRGDLLVLSSASRKLIDSCDTSRDTFQHIPPPFKLDDVIYDPFNRLSNPLSINKYLYINNSIVAAELQRFIHLLYAYREETLSPMTFIRPSPCLQWLCAKSRFCPVHPETATSFHPAAMKLTHKRQRHRRKQLFAFDPLSVVHRQRKSCSFTSSSPPLA